MQINYGDVFQKLFRKQEWYENEKIIVNEIIRRCPNEFEGLSAFEKLVKMQHYGAPTRLLDFYWKSTHSIIFCL